MADADEDEELLIEEVEPGEFKGESKSDSALDASKTGKGELSYYYCQEKGKDGKEYFGDAIIREHDPTFRADGLGPKKLEVDKTTPEQQEDEAPAKTKWIQNFSFSGEGPVAKVYVEFPESVKNAKIECKFGQFSVDLLVRQPNDGEIYGFRVKEKPGRLYGDRHGGFVHEIDPEKSKYRISSSGERITLSLHKEKSETWYELKKQDKGF